MTIILGIASLIIAYLLGSFPAGYLIALRQKGIDIREVGVRNMGAGNVIREVGKWPGAITGICDVGKGALAVYIAQVLGSSQPWVLAAAVVVVLGHNYPLFIGFKGGKGIATVLGAFLVLSPFATLCTIGVIGTVLIFHRNFFVAIEICSPFFLLFIWLFDGVGPVFYCGAAIVAFQFFRNRSRLKEIGALTSSMAKIIREKIRA